MDFRKILAGFDAVENNTSASAVAKNKEKGSMLAILESFNRVENEETVEEAKPDFLDIDKDGDKKESMKKAAKDKEDKEKTDESIEEELDEAIMVSAEGDEAAQLLSILQLAGMQPSAPAPMPAPTMGPMEPAMGPMEPSMDMDMQDEYSNSPDEFEQDVDSVIASGNDLHREKGQYAASAPGDNPMRAFEGKFKSILADLLKE